MKNPTKQLPTLCPGFWAALTLKAGAAPLRCYVGEVQSVDIHGVRITLIDWLVGGPFGYDVFVPWTNLESALVATQDHDLKRFGEEAAKWQERCAAEGISA